MGAGPGAASPDSGASAHRLSLRPLFEIAGAAAGFVVLIQLVGRAVVWARFHAIGLPATQAVSLQSTEDLLGYGTGALALAIFLGLAAIAALVGVDALLEPRGVRRQGRVVVLAVLELLLVAAVLEQPASWAQRLVALGAGLAAGVTFWILSERNHVRQLVLATFLLIAAVGGVLAFVRNSGPPVRLPMVTLFLKDGSVTTGAYVALKADAAYIAPDSFNRTYGQVAAIPREDVRRIALSPPQDYEAAGVSGPRSLLAGRTVQRPYGSVAPAIARYLASQAGDVVWRYPPVSFLESAFYISRHPATFFDPTAARPAVDRGRHVPLTQLVHGARDYSGRPVITRGVVLRSSDLPGGADNPDGRFVTLRGIRDPRVRAFCVRSGVGAPRVGATVSAEGVIVNAGTVVSDDGTTVKGVFLETAGNACGV